MQPTVGLDARDGTYPERLNEVACGLAHGRRGGPSWWESQGRDRTNWKAPVNAGVRELLYHLDGLCHQFGPLAATPQLPDGSVATLGRVGVARLRTHKMHVRPRRMQPFKSPLALGEPITVPHGIMRCTYLPLSDPQITVLQAEEVHSEAN